MKKPKKPKVKSSSPIQKKPPLPREPIQNPAKSLPQTVALRRLTEEERTARAHALAESKVNEAEERRLAEDAAIQRDSSRKTNK